MLNMYSAAMAPMLGCVARSDSKWNECRQFSFGLTTKIFEASIRPDLRVPPRTCTRFSASSQGRTDRLYRKFPPRPGSLEPESPLIPILFPLIPQRGVLDAASITDFPDIRMRCALHSESSGSVMVIAREDGLVQVYIQLSETAKGVDRASITSEMISNAARKIMAPYKLDMRE